MLCRLVGCLAILVSATFPSLGAEPLSAEQDSPPPPWHLVDLWWDLGQEQPFESYSIDVEIRDDVPPPKNLYIASIPVAEIPQVTVTFGKLVVNGKPMKPTTVTATYPTKLPDYAEAVAKDGAVVITVGQPVENRTQRKVQLLEK
jgi:hypothetical protein